MPMAAAVQIDAYLTRGWYLSSQNQYLRLKTDQSILTLKYCYQVDGLCLTL
jgi:hypothetical protein